MALHLVKKRSIYVPTWRGWLLLAGTLVAIVAVVVLNVHPFLAISAPVPANLLVVDGWMSDASLERAIDEFRQGDYDLFCTTGGPLARGAHLSEYNSYAELAAASLRKLGFDADRLLIAPSPGAVRNRTFASAVALKKQLDEQHVAIEGMNLITGGLHARRSRTVYRKVFGSDVPMGVISLPSSNYDADRWWESSAGLKAVITETLTWLFEWLDDAGRDPGCAPCPPPHNIAAMDSTQHTDTMSAMLWGGDGFSPTTAVYSCESPSHPVNAC